jgi:hypothetical protein
MKNQLPVPYGLLYSIAPEQFAYLHLGDDAVGNELGGGESENQYEGESLASNVLEFLKELLAE